MTGGHFNRWVFAGLLSLLLVPAPYPLSSGPEAFAMARRPPREAMTSAKTDPRITYTLWDCYILALRRSDTIAIRKEDIEETQALFYQATSEALGHVDFVMTHFSQQRERSIPGANSFAQDSVGRSSTRPVRRESKFVIEQPVFQGFRALASLRAAGSLTKEKREQRIRAEQLLFQDVAGAFYFVQYYKHRLEDYGKILKAYEDRLAELEKREKIGKSRLSELSAVRSEMNIRKAEMEVTRGELAKSVHEMEFLIGVSLEPEDLKDDEPEPEKPKGYEAYLGRVASRPDVKAAFQSVRSYQSNIIEAQSGLWPHMFLDFNHYEKREGFQSNTDWDALFTVDVPIFKGGETLGKIKTAVSQWKKAKLTYSEISREAEKEIKQAYDIWAASSAATAAYQEAFGSSKENYRLQGEDYKRNLVSNLDVLAALATLFETSRDYLESYYTMKQNYWKLKIAAGECCEEMKEAKP